MLSQDSDLRRRQVVALALMGTAYVAAVAGGMLLGAVFVGKHSSALPAAVACLAATLGLGIGGAVLWGLSGNQDVKRHPNRNVARNRLSLGG